MNYLGYVAYAGYLVVGLIQLFAIAAGLSFALGVSDFFGFALAFFLTWIPLIGIVAGVYGAITVWGWWWLWAVLFFAWPTLLWIIVMGGASVVDWLDTRRANGG
jgi:hypothetical protein